MPKSSIISNKILSFKSQSFIRGIILIEDEIIEDVIQFSEDISLIQISNSFSE